MSKKSVQKQNLFSDKPAAIKFGSGNKIRPFARTTRKSSLDSRGAGFTSIDLSSLLLSSAESVFEGCSSLLTFTIPPTVKDVGTGCFRNCEKLVTVTYLGDSEVTNLLFEGSNALTNVEVKAGYPYDQFGGFWFKRNPVDSSSSSDIAELTSSDDNDVQVTHSDDEGGITSSGGDNGIPGP